MDTEAVEILVYKIQNEIRDLEIAQDSLTTQARDIDAKYKLNNIKIKLLTDYLKTYTPPVNNATTPKHRPP